MNPATWIFMNWKLILLGTAITSTAILYGYAMSQKNRADRLEEKIAEIQRIASEYEKESTRTVKEINDAIPRMVAQAEANAYKNYLKKYGNNAACGIRYNSLPTDNSAGQTDRSERTDEPSQSEFVVACATDAGIIEQWRNWAIANQLPVQ